jgi:dual specificity phosphatase 12
MGKSRSTTLIIAFLLSLSATTTPASALASIRTVRSFAEPNAGFQKQLELYHKMGCPADVASHPVYQRWLYQCEVEASIACGRAPDTIRFSDEENKPTNQEGVEMEYRCRKCRKSLATSAYVLAHEAKVNSVAIAESRTAPISSLQAVPSQPLKPPPCAHLFLDPLSWMRQELEQGKLDGRLECPNERCRANVGKYAWQGMRCSCGEWVVPGISLVRSRIDEVKARSRAVEVGKI